MKSKLISTLLFIILLGGCSTSGPTLATIRGDAKKNPVPKKIMMLCEKYGGADIWYIHFDTHYIGVTCKDGKHFSWKENTQKKLLSWSK